MGGIAVGWYVLIYLISEDALFDSLTALSLLIAFYYALTGIACAVYHRRQLLRSASNLLFIGVGPLVGAAMLIYLLVLAVSDLNDPEASSSGVSWFGLGPPLVIGIGIFLLGIVLMIGWRVHDARFWQERPGLAPDPGKG